MSLLLMANAASASTCSQYTTCSDCVTHETFKNTCRWCEIDNTCHDHGSLANTCHSFENIHELKYCQCNGLQPAPGVDASVCDWYTDTTGSSDPTQWKGGDFLPDQYKSAAHCACSGCGTLIKCNRIWQKAPNALTCVRKQLIEAHKSLNATFRQFVKVSMRR